MVQKLIIHLELYSIMVNVIIVRSKGRWNYFISNSIDIVFASKNCSYLIHRPTLTDIMINYMKLSRADTGFWKRGGAG